jgi:hypothetical protein
MTVKPLHIVAHHKASNSEKSNIQRVVRNPVGGAVGGCGCECDRPATCTAITTTVTTQVSNGILSSWAGDGIIVFFIEESLKT